MTTPRYCSLTPIEIVEYLCQNSANGYREEEVTAKEQELGISFPEPLRTYLLRAGRECISIRRKEMFPLHAIEREGSYLILGETDQGAIGIQCDAVSESDPEVFIREFFGDWSLLEESITAYLLLEIDRRIRELEANEYLDIDADEDDQKLLVHYFYCQHFTIKELAAKEGDLFGGNIDEISETLQNNTNFVTRASYLIGFCLDRETNLLYCGHLAQNGSIGSLLQVNSQSTRYLYEKVSLERLKVIEALFAILAREVHDPVYAYCIQKRDALPERIYHLANEELHNYILATIGKFLALFDQKKTPWKLGVPVSENFVQCSGLSDWVPLEDLWWGHHLKAAAEPWEPTLTRTATDGEPASEHLEPLVKEIIYQLRDYSLLNRFAFLSKKIVTNGRYSKLTADYTNIERFALLSFYRDMLDGVVERLFDCLERRLFTIHVKERDFVSLCPNPTAEVSNWLRWYRKKELDFLDTGYWE